jgi:hypothetical protein
LKNPINYNSSYLSKQKEIISIIDNFNTTGVVFGDGNRNVIKLYDLDAIKVNVKSFKKPHLLNSIIYRYFRKSKARRSFEYANRLLENQIGTPQPIAYFENTSIFGLSQSYYISEHLDCDLTFRELVQLPEFPENEIILRQFIRFTYLLHQKGIEFLDHSPGNTLIKKNIDGVYDFFLVDLNRMTFHKEMAFDIRMKNLCRLTYKEEMVKIMSNEYAIISGESEEIIFQTLWKKTTDFQNQYFRKRRLKKKLKFWKK